jgi:hypothetical protein
MKFPVHRVILAAKSPELKFKIDACSDDRELLLTDVDGKNLMEMMRFLYTGEIVYNWPNISTLLKAAAAYKIEELRAKCVAYLIDELSLENIFDVLSRAEESNELYLKHECIKFIKR